MLKNQFLFEKGMEYRVVAELFDDLSKTSSRLKKTTILASFLKKTDFKNFQEIILLAQGRVFPEWNETSLGVAGKLVLHALELASGHSSRSIEVLFKEKGDIGDTVYELIAQKKQQTLFSQPLALLDVFSSLQHIASLQGSGSQDAKLATLNKLLTSATPLEAKFIVRTVIEDLRVGVARGIIRDALYYAYFTDSFSYDETTHSFNWESSYDREETLKLLQRAYDFTADFGYILSYVREGNDLASLSLQLGKPCKPMLARKEKTFSEAFARTGFPVRIEYKYDGFRLQIHKKGSSVQLFTRRLDDVTAQFPDVVAAVLEHISVNECILDGEVIGYDPQTRAYVPFQHISRRIKRKHHIDQLVKELPVELTLFDVLSLDGALCIDLPLSKRLELLSQTIQSTPRVLSLVKGVEVTEEAAAQVLYQESLDAGNEGVMIKDLNATYQPGNRVSAWIKMKPTMEELDLVIVGAEWGSGKRSSWLTSFTLACIDEDGQFFEIGKVGTGLKEELHEDHLSFAQLTSLLEPLIISEQGKEVRVRPEVVVEIAYEEIQKSTTYSSGFALRFPRVLRLRTSERSADDVALLDEVIDLYRSQ